MPWFEFKFDRVGWLIVFFGGVAFATYFCVAMWKKWEDSPTLMSLETTRYPLINIPFPAVSICGVNKISKRRLDVALANIKSDDSDQSVSFFIICKALTSYSLLIFSLVCVRALKKGTISERYIRKNSGNLEIHDKTWSGHRWRTLRISQRFASVLRRARHYIKALVSFDEKCNCELFIT